MPASDVLSLAARYRAALLAQDVASGKRLIDAYVAIKRRLQGLYDALGMEIAAQATTPTRGQVMRMERYRELLAQVEDELDRYHGFAATEINTAAHDAVEMAQKHARGLVTAQAGIDLAWNRLPTDAIESLLGFLDPTGPLFGGFAKLGEETAKRASQVILENIALGLGPRQWAGKLDEVLGSGLTSSLRLARTVQVKSYQEATRANYVANADIVDGWIWYAKLDADTCLSCVSQHGTVHTNDEALDDHWNGRCAMIPNVVGAENPVGQGGQEWFDSLPAEEQQAMMGKEKHAAYAAGMFDFAALSRQDQHEVWGTMRTETPLKELVPA